MDKTLYQLIGVSSNATPDEIRGAYYKLALKHHPDRVKDSDKAENEVLFKDIANAYEILSDAQRRADYDNDAISNNSNQSPFELTQKLKLTEGNGKVSDTDSASIPDSSESNNLFKQSLCDLKNVLSQHLPEYKPLLYRLEHPESGVLYMMGSKHDYNLDFTPQMTDILNNADLFGSSPNFAVNSHLSGLLS